MRRPLSWCVAVLESAGVHGGGYDGKADGERTGAISLLPSAGFRGGRCYFYPRGSREVFQAGGELWVPTPVVVRR